MTEAWQCWPRETGLPHGGVSPWSPGSRIAVCNAYCVCTPSLGLLAPVRIGTVPFSPRYRWRMGGTEGRERRWCGNLWRLRYVAPTAATSPTCARTNRPHRSRRLSQRQSLSHPARHAWDDLRGWPLRRPLSQAGSAGLPTLAAGPDHADAVPRGLERSTSG